MYEFIIKRHTERERGKGKERDDKIERKGNLFLHAQTYKEREREGG
jgi:hypothetical protein